MCKVHCIPILLGTFDQFCLSFHVPVCVCLCLQVSGQSSVQQTLCMAPAPGWPPFPKLQWPVCWAKEALEASAMETAYGWEMIENFSGHSKWSHRILKITLKVLSLFIMKHIIFKKINRIIFGAVSGLQKIEQIAQSSIIPPPSPPPPPPYSFPIINILQ